MRGCCVRMDGRAARAMPAPCLTPDAAAAACSQATEEGQKVARNAGRTWRAVYRRLAAPRELASNPEQLALRK